MSRINISVDLVGTEGDERKKRLATAVQAGLNIAGTDPEIRLRMILGEALQRYKRLVEWLCDEIVKDETKAPGLTELAEAFADDIELLLQDPNERRQPFVDSGIKWRLLQEALSTMLSVPEPKQLEVKLSVPMPPVNSDQDQNN